jgi:hypothetical protein
MLVINTVVGLPIAAAVTFYIILALKARRIGREARPFRYTPVLVIIALLVFLFAIQLTKYSACSLTSEAKINLEALYVAQSNYFASANTFTGGMNPFQVLHWSPNPEAAYYAYFCGEDYIPASYRYAPNPKPDAKWTLPIRAKTSRNTFTCLAVGDIDYDDILDIWSINNDKVLLDYSNDEYGEGGYSYHHLSMGTRVYQQFYDAFHNFRCDSRVGIAMVLCSLPYMLLLISLFFDARRYRAAKTIRENSRA